MPVVLTPSGAFTVQEDEHSAFWSDVTGGRWESQTLEAIRYLCTPGTRFVDVGAWIGPTTLAAAAGGAEVVAFEPDPPALVRPRENVASNPRLAERITIMGAALTATDGSLSFSSDGGFSGSSSQRQDGQRRKVDGGGVGTAIQRGLLEPCNVLKIDIEGGEYALMPALADLLAAAAPILILSLHMLQEWRPPGPRHLAGPAFRFSCYAAQLGILTSLLPVYRYWYAPSAERKWRRIRPRLLAAVRHTGHEVVLSSRSLGGLFAPTARSWPFSF